MVQQLKRDTSLLVAACDAIRIGLSFRDLLAVMLQICYYIGNYGDVGSTSRNERKSFHLMKLQSFEDLRLGKKHSFRSIVCIILRNLRGSSRKIRKEQTITLDRSNGDNYGFTWSTSSWKVLGIQPEGLIAEWNERATDPHNRHVSEPLRCNAKITAVNSNRDPTCFSDELDRRQRVDITVAQDTLSFMEQLEHELQDCREVVRKEMKLEDIESCLQDLRNLRAFVVRSLQNENALFNAKNENSGVEYVTMLQIWSKGRRSLLELEANLTLAISECEAAIETVREAEMRLKKFAAIRTEDFSKYGYNDIFKVVLTFVDRLKQSWNELDDKNPEYQNLQKSLYTTYCLSVIWGTSDECMESTFTLWRRKEQDHRTGGGEMMEEWSEKVKTEKIETLFAIFDTDNDRSVDWSELKLTIQGLGLKCDDDEVQELLCAFDKNGDGVMEMDEFREMLDARIDFVFQQFTEKESNWIGTNDVQRVAKELGRSIAEGDAERMIKFLTTGTGDDRVSRERFDRLILGGLDCASKQRGKKKEPNLERSMSIRATCLEEAIMPVTDRSTRSFHFIPPSFQSSSQCASETPLT